MEAVEWNGARKVAWRRGARGEGAKAEAEAEVVRARRATDLSWNCPGPRKGIAGWADGRGRRFGVVSAENWEERDVDRIGSDKIGSDKIGSDKIGSDRNSRREDDPGAGKANGRGAAGGGGGERDKLIGLQLIGLRLRLDSPWGGQTDAGTDRCAGRLGAWIAMMQWSGGIDWLHILFS
jgi:hypothetical protein